MKKIILVFTLFISFVGFLSAQEVAPESKGFDKSRLFFGGTFGLGFSNYSTAINISPQIGYRFSQYFAAGAGVNYAYYQYKYYYAYSNSLYQKSTYSYAGLSVFGRLYPIPFLFLQAQPEVNYVWGKDQLYNPDQEYKVPTQFVPSFLVGVGGAIPAGRGAITISILYDVVQNTYSPYFHQALYTFGFTTGF